MTHDEALRLASGYAWGREDVSHVPTVGDDGGFAFSQAFAAGYDDYNRELRCNMVTVRGAYETWQASAGFSVFPAGDTTAEQALRHAVNRRKIASQAGKRFGDDSTLGDSISLRARVNTGQDAAWLRGEARISAEDQAVADAESDEINAEFDRRAAARCGHPDCIDVWLGSQWGIGRLSGPRGCR